MERERGALLFGVLSALTCSPAVQSPGSALRVLDPSEAKKKRDPKEARSCPPLCLEAAAPAAVLFQLGLLEDSGKAAAGLIYQADISLN